jgi:oligopeptide/dipeptide ABC transporter ATP-binding protein
MDNITNPPLLELENLTIKYETDEGMLTATSEVSFEIREGDNFGLVGESGCGKSTLAKAIIGGLDDNGVVSSGKIKYRGEEIQDMSEKELNEKIRWSEISFIPQSAMDSLNPLQRMSDQAREIAKVHDVDVEDAMERFRDLFEVMGLDKNRVTDYPHQFSGGMKQRVVIALSLFLRPSIVIADEPTTALDVIMQDQIMKYIEKLQDEFDISIILITHDISLVFESFERMGVMHGGQLCELGSTRDIYYNPRHPYTILLQQAFPDIREPGRELNVIEGIPPTTYGELSRCSFSDRCPIADDRCLANSPPMEELSKLDGESRGASHGVACVKPRESAEHFDVSTTTTESSGGD